MTKIDFESATVGALPPGITGALTGSRAAAAWIVLEDATAPAGPKVLAQTSTDKTDYRFLRFRPPLLQREGTDEPALPHIRLDRALQFLIGDRLQ